MDTIKDKSGMPVWYAVYLNGQLHITRSIAYVEAQTIMQPMPFISRMREGTLIEGMFAEMDYFQIHKVSNFINGV